MERVIISFCRDVMTEAHHITAKSRYKHVTTKTLHMITKAYHICNDKIYNGKSTSHNTL